MAAKRGRLVALCMAAAALSLGAEQRGHQPTASEQLVMVLKWRAAARSHVLGQFDDSVRWVGGLSLDEWKLLNTSLRNYFTHLPLDQARGLLNPLLEHAAVLHMDAARFGPLAPASKIDSGGWQWTGPPVSLVLTLDGQALGSTDANWNWMLARLLISVMDAPRKVPFVVAWYHASAAWMLEHGLSGELGTHLQHADSIVPGDAPLIYDRACLDEALASPSIQLGMNDLREKHAAASRRATFNPGEPPEFASPAFPTAGQSIASAEHGFRRVLDLDPNFVEARVRLARLLTLQKKYGEAATELEPVLRADAFGQDAVLGYYAHLFAARASQRLGRLDDASAHVAQALARFPDAQSALMAQSQLALMRSEADGALVAVRKLARLPGDPERRRDPWWLYELGPGRQTELYMADMWSKIETFK